MPNDRLRSAGTDRRELSADRSGSRVGISRNKRYELDAFIFLHFFLVVVYSSVFVFQEPPSTSDERRLQATAPAADTDASEFENKTPHKKFVSPQPLPPPPPTRANLDLRCTLRFVFCPAETEPDGRQETRQVRAEHQRRHSAGGDRRWPENRHSGWRRRVQEIETAGRGESHSRDFGRRNNI